MSESTETRVGVPGDARLENPNIEKPQSWFAKLPVVRDLKIAVGWQKGMLVTGLVLTGVLPARGGVRAVDRAIWICADQG